MLVAPPDTVTVAQVPLWVSSNVSGLSNAEGDSSAPTTGRIPRADGHCGCKPKFCNAAAIAAAWAAKLPYVAPPAQTAWIPLQF